MGAIEKGTEDLNCSAPLSKAVLGSATVKEAPCGFSTAQTNSKLIPDLSSKTKQDGNGVREARRKHLQNLSNVLPQSKSSSKSRSDDSKATPERVKSNTGAMSSSTKTPDSANKKLTFIDMFAEIGGVETLLSKMKEKSAGKRSKKSAGPSASVEPKKSPDRKQLVSNEADAPDCPSNTLPVLESVKPAVEAMIAPVEEDLSDSSKLENERQQSKDDFPRCFVRLERLPKNIVDRRTIRLKEINGFGSSQDNVVRKRSRESSMPGNERYRCRLCDYQSSSRIYFKRHRVKHRKHLAMRTCPDCGFSSTDASSLHLHRCRMDDEDVRCRFCELMFAPIDLQTHLWEKHARLLGSVARSDGTVPFSCYYCSFVALDKKILKNHIRVHMAKIPMHAIELHNGRLFHVCHYCNFRTWRIGDIKRHFFETKVHSTGKTYNCSYCGMTYLSKTSMVRHKLLKHKRHKLKTGTCTKCNKKLPNQFKLLSHMRQHSKALRKEECNLCGLVVADLKRHYLHAHTDTRLYQCPPMQRSFQAENRTQATHATSHEYQAFRVQGFGKNGRRRIRRYRRQAQEDLGREWFLWPPTLGTGLRRQTLN
ncbi:unnamed protein product [Nesidiocoris tenuis]|uniref:C2H2-type domain-containing protein n=1 Tax=Nesidiocoris tenuis TaxID=355587 RepID=A0A6H5G0B7_9HEMI|nr:unnamed protein product [Nesidiocoris tenuis]